MKNAKSIETDYYLRQIVDLTLNIISFHAKMLNFGPT